MNRRFAVVKVNKCVQYFQKLLRNHTNYNTLNFVIDIINTKSTCERYIGNTNIRNTFHKEKVFLSTNCDTRV